MEPISELPQPGTETNSDSTLSATSDGSASTTSSFSEPAALPARVTQSFTMETVSLTAQLDQTTMERPASLVLLHKSGTELNALTDATQEKSGTLHLQPASAQPVNSGTDMLASSAPTERPGTSTLKTVNAQSHQLGTESPASFVLEEDSTTMLPTNASVQADKPSMDTFAPSTAHQVKFITKL